MPGMLQVNNVFQLIKGINSLSFHVLFQGGRQFESLAVQQLASQLFHPFRYRLSVIDITRCYAQGQEFALVIDDQVSFETIKPAG